MKLQKDLVSYIFLKLWQLNISEPNQQIKKMSFCNTCWKCFHLPRKLIEYDDTEYVINLPYDPIKCICCDKYYCNESCFSVETENHYW